MIWEQIVTALSHASLEMTPYLYLQIVVTIWLVLFIFGVILEDSRKRKPHGKYLVYLPPSLRLIEGYPARRHPT